MGVGNTGYGVFPETDAVGLGVSALRAAVADAGIRFEDIDGVILNRLPYDRFAEVSGLNTPWLQSTEAHGRFSAIALMMAAEALASGQATTIALVYGNDGRSNAMKYGGGAGFWAPWGFTSPGASHAMMWRRHMARFGTTSADLGHIAVAFRDHASRNPQAVMQKPISLEDHQNSRFICDPLHLLDYCLINDGGVAWIMTTPERAKDLRQKPVYVSGFARQDDFSQNSYAADDFWHPALQQVAAQVYDRAGVSREDIDGLMIYDNFSPTVIFALEGLGFCPQGEGGRFVADGALQLGKGRWPTNTSGGHLSESYMQGWALIAEGVRQLRGEVPPARQIPDAKALQFCLATPVSASIILRTDA
ncbi:MAG TPA: thiolase family protein [Novosphingobium sp.]|nr:thiolase family protein [Novosphingobium sp.]HZV09960.1 thiolase family protein [Novosphingobium sp.]